MIRSPIRWAGGKSRLRRTLIPMLPEHRHYAEPFAGGAWVFFGKPRSGTETLNDIDGELANFYRVLRDRAQELIDYFRWELVSRAEFDRHAGTDPETLDEVQRAHRFFYLTMAGWGGESGYPRFQTPAAGDAGHGNRLAGALLNLKDRLWPASERLRGVEISSLDWRECLERHDRPESLLYLDPPYPGNGVNYRHNMRGEAEHRELAERLARAQCRWVLSTYDNALARECYANCRLTPVSWASGMEDGNGGRTVNRELLVSNFRPQGQLRMFGQEER